jgi:hypothetical protein
MKLKVKEGRGLAGAAFGFCAVLMGQHVAATTQAIFFNRYLQTFRVSTINP